VIESGPLAGFTIGVTSVRRWHEFGTALEQRGARIVYAPAIRIVNPADDSALLAATTRCLELPLDIVIATTAVGIRTWLDAAQTWGIGPALRDRLNAVELIARGPRSRAALRAAGFAQVWAPENDSATDVLEHLLHRDLTGRQVLVQSHGAASRDLITTLTHLGAIVHEITTFGWLEPLDIDALEQLVDAVGDGQLDAVCFTTPAAVESFLQTARRIGQAEAVLQKLRGPAVAACIGPVTAAPLVELDVPVAMPARPRLGSLVREIVEVLGRRGSRMIEAAGHRIEVRGHAIVVDGHPHLPGTEAMLVAKALIAHPGRVIPRAQLQAQLPPGADLPEAIRSLNATLADSRALQTIADHGYRLAYEPGHTGGCGHEFD
jgi:uroporphyrinogen-III synthase